MKWKQIGLVALSAFAGVIAAVSVVAMFLPRGRTPRAFDYRQCAAGNDLYGRQFPARAGEVVAMDGPRSQPQGDL